MRSTSAGEYEHVRVIRELRERLAKAEAERDRYKEPLRALTEYGGRLEAEVPALVERAIERARRVRVDAGRVASGVIAHSGSLPSFRAALEDAREALAKKEKD